MERIPTSFVKERLYRKNLKYLSELPRFTLSSYKGEQSQQRIYVVSYSGQTGVLKPHENIPMAKPLLMQEEVDLVSRASRIFPVSNGPRDSRLTLGGAGKRVVRLVPRPLSDPSRGVWV